MITTTSKRRGSSSGVDMLSVGPKISDGSDKSQAGGVGRDHWTAIQTGMLSLFRGEVNQPLPQLDIFSLNEVLRVILKTESRSHVISYYEKKLLPLCFVNIREELIDKTGMTLLTELAAWWKHFFRRLMPVVRLVFQPAPTPQLSIHHMSLLVFRNVVVVPLGLQLKTAIAELMAGEEEDAREVPDEIVQMLLILQSIPEQPPSDSYKQLEPIVQLIVHPYYENTRLVNLNDFAALDDAKTPLPSRRHTLGETQLKVEGQQASVEQGRPGPNLRYSASMRLSGDLVGSFLDLKRRYTFTKRHNTDPSGAVSSYPP